MLPPLITQTQKHGKKKKKGSSFKNTEYTILMYKNLWKKK